MGLDVANDWTTKSFQRKLTAPALLTQNLWPVTPFTSSCVGYCVHLFEGFGLRVTGIQGVGFEEGLGSRG